MAAKKKPAAKRTKRTRASTKKSVPDWAAAFLAQLAKTGCIKAACIKAKVGRSTVYERRDADKDFARQLAEALEDATDDLELEARRRAYLGLDVPVIYKGQLCGMWLGEAGEQVAQAEPGARFVPLTIKEYSDQLLTLLLRANRPGKYRENLKVEHGGKVDHTHDLDLTTLTDEQLTQLEAILGPLAG